MVQPSPFYALASPLPYEICGTSLNSSRMCTACALTVSPNMPCTKGGGAAPGGGVCSGGVCSGGVPALGVPALEGGVCSWGGYPSMH